MKIYLFNDTAGGHAGSRAVMEGVRVATVGHEIIHANEAHRKNIDFRAMNECDAVLVNGEGTIHHNAKAAKFLIGVLRVAQTMNKKTLLINSTFQDMDRDFCADVLRRLNYFCVRETMSYEYAKKFGAGVTLRMDLSAGVDLADSKMIKPLKGIARGATHPDSEARGILDNMNIPYFGLEGNFKDVVKTLQQAECYITGQFHGIIAAGLAGIPFVPIASNSWKIKGLIQWSNIPFIICRNLSEVKKQAIWAVHPKNKFYFEKFHEFLKRMPVFSSNDLQGALGL